MVDVDEQTGGSATQNQPSEEEMRAAYEAELNRITSSEMILQTAVSLLNIGGRRLGLAAPTTPGAPAGATAERDLEQVRDAIDGASALLPILERRMPRELGPLRDAVAQLQVAYAREAQSASNTTATTAPAAMAEPEKPREKQERPADGEQQQGPGPAQASGRLWVPGR
jgi:hypothetical protein